MIECPQCNNNITGYACECGYTIPRARNDGWEHRKQRDKVADDAEHLAECKRWLLKERIVTDGMTKGERMKAMANYRTMIANSPPPDPLDWARRILARMEDGENISVYQERMAKEALGAA